MMENTLRSFLNTLKLKYSAENELHKEIDRKIRERLTSYADMWNDSEHLQEVILQQVEETYRRMLSTKRDLSTAKKLLNQCQQITQKNLEKLLELKDSVQHLKSVAEKQKEAITQPDAVSSNPTKPHRFNGWNSNAQPDSDLPMGFCGN